MHKLKKLYLGLFIVFATITFLSAIFLLVCSLVLELSSIPALSFIVAFFAIAAAIFGTAFFMKFLQISEEIRSLHTENLYNFGFESLFYNYPLFKRRVKKLNKKHHHKGNYLVAFSTCKKTVSRNLYRDNEIMQLNGLLSKYLDKLFTENKQFSINEFAYCYYHGQFIVYTFIPLHDIQDIISANKRVSLRLQMSNRAGLYLWAISVNALSSDHCERSLNSACLGSRYSLNTGRMSHDGMAPHSAALTMEIRASSSVTGLSCRASSFSSNDRYESVIASIVSSTIEVKSMPEV